LSSSSGHCHPSSSGHCHHRQVIVTIVRSLSSSGHCHRQVIVIIVTIITPSQTPRTNAELQNALVDAQLRAKEDEVW
jgi:hypothetical protein